jgi:hypothetical protein
MMLTENSPVRANKRQCFFKTSNDVFFKARSGRRYYSSELGRWLNRDPIGERGAVVLFGASRSGCSGKDQSCTIQYSCHREEQAKRDRQAIEGMPCQPHIYTDAAPLYVAINNNLLEFYDYLGLEKYSVRLYVRQPKPGTDTIRVGGFEYGHTFVRIELLEKENCVLVVGFYPTGAGESLNKGPQRGKVVSDLHSEQKNEFHVYRTWVKEVDLTWQDVQTYIDEYAMNHQYDLDDNSCAHFGLQVLEKFEISLPESFGRRVIKQLDNKMVLYPGALGEDLANQQGGIRNRP